MENSPSNKKVHFYITEWRKKFAMTQTKLAALTGTTSGKISKLESGEQQMTDRWLWKICSTLKITPEDLLRHPDKSSTIVETKNSQRKVPIFGYAGMGETLHIPSASAATWHDFLGLTGLNSTRFVATPIKGPDLEPLFLDGGCLLFFDQPDEASTLTPDPQTLYLCALADGRFMVKTLTPALDKGQFNLHYPTTPTVKDQPLRWVRKMFAYVTKP